MSSKNTNKLKILNDPVHGLISIPNSLIFDIIEHPFFQRLRRVTQMGMSNLVYPGANHTRYHHAIGCMHLMQKAIRGLQSKNVLISEDELNAACIAILLHDIGHGAFSHALEHSIVNGITHEEISLKFMRALNEEFNGKLNLAIEIFEGNYKRKFLCQLISSQLDIDRLDYLQRDSFYTGVTEGNISAERIITMMNVVDDELVLEQKSIYSVEKFVIARRLMYWQVYLHKTGLVAENILVNILKRAKQLASQKKDVFGSSALRYFLYNEISPINFSKTTLNNFAKLDDYDVLSAIKEWTYHEDFILSSLAKMIINRKLLKIELQEKSFTEVYINKLKTKYKKELKLTDAELEYFVFGGHISNQAYNLDKPITIYTKKGKLIDLAKASDQLNVQVLTKKVSKHYICYPK